MFDPPSGWKYGFPFLIPNHTEISRDYLIYILRQHNYPEEDIDFAIQHGRFIEIKE